MSVSSPSVRSAPPASTPLASDHPLYRHAPSEPGDRNCAGLPSAWLISSAARSFSSTLMTRRVVPPYPVACVGPCG
eukprot:2103398-Pyramimonas_sp.AAC.1